MCLLSSLEVRLFVQQLGRQSVPATAAETGIAAAKSRQPFPCADLHFEKYFVPEMSCEFCRDSCDFCPKL